MQSFLVSHPNSIAISPIRNLSAAKQIKARIPSLAIIFSLILEQRHADYDWPQGTSGAIRETPRGVLSRELESSLIEIRRRLHALESVYEVHDGTADWFSASDPYLRDLELMASMTDEEAENVARIRNISVAEVKFFAHSKYQSARKSRIEHIAIGDLCADEIAFCDVEELEAVTSRCKDMAMRVINFSKIEELTKDFLDQFKMRWGAQSA